MKYVISDSEFEPIVIMGNTMHSDLARGIYGRIGSAGHFKIVDGKVETYGRSIGLSMEPASRDADIIRVYLGL